MFMSFAFFVLSNIVVSINFVRYSSSLVPFLFMCLLKEDSGSTGEKQIDDLHFSICISKSSIYFYPVTPESSSGVTRKTIGKKLADKKIEERPAPGQYELKSHLNEGPQHSLYHQYSQ